MYDKVFQSINNNPLYYSLVFIVELLIIYFIVYKLNPLNVKNKYPFEVQGLITLFVVFQVLNILFLRERNRLIFITKPPTLGEFMEKNVLTIVYFIVILAIIYLLITSLTTTEDYVEKIIKHSFNIAIILGATYIIFKILNNLGKIKDIRKSLMLTLLVELVLYGLFLLWSKIENYINKNKGVSFNGPVYLNKKTQVGSFKELHNDERNYNYTIDFLYWINPQPPNTNENYSKYTNIMEYGERPKVEYNPLTNKLRVQCKMNDNDTETICEIDEIKFQKWNNMKIVVNNGFMDVFNNGKLVGSKQNISPHITYENVNLGEDNGIYGGIKDFSIINNIY